MLKPAAKENRALMLRLATKLRVTASVGDDIMDG